MNSDIFHEEGGDTFSVGQRLPSLEPLSLLDGREDAVHHDELRQALERGRLESREALRALQLRLDKVTQRIQGLEDGFKNFAREYHEKIQLVATRVRDRGQGEAKIEALIERHNQIVQSFELRLGQAQKLIDNQSLQLAKQQGLIDEARRHIEKLKNS